MIHSVEAEFAKLEVTLSLTLLKESNVALPFFDIVESSGMCIVVEESYADDVTNV